MNTFNLMIRFGKESAFMIVCHNDSGLDIEEIIAALNEILDLYETQSESAPNIISHVVRNINDKCDCKAYSITSDVCAVMKLTGIWLTTIGGENEHD